MSDSERRAHIGSITAKGGFLNEAEIVSHFNSWQTSALSQSWLKHMGYDLEKITKLEALHIPTRISKETALIFGISIEEYQEATKFKKADAQLKIVIKLGNITKVENISLKKSNSDSDFNQIDKRPVDTYQKMWEFDEELTTWLKLFSGEIIPSESNFLEKKEYREFDKRLFIDEFPKRIVVRLLDFIEKNKILIISDIIKGRGPLSADWILVTKLETSTNKQSWVLVDINMAMNYFGSGEVKVSPRGSIHIGKITLQRKGGTPDPTSLQFKINPLGLFDLAK
ncbi:type II restriction endonuclease [Leptospira levettii]|uniref:type II restriction endonuclease n=1 Tax=Leptospira levettii TaxID=2023178 RepID=UPI001082C4F1|nr:type II restriction endonuclease [Leptospira levettii]TGL00791.1 type II restriction endonuclease [Leptospira levettii]